MAKETDKGANAVVTADIYSWYEESENPETPLHTAYKGDEIKVSADELKRGLALHESDGAGLAKIRSDDAKDAKTEAEESAAADAAAAPSEA